MKPSSKSLQWKAIWNGLWSLDGIWPISNEFTMLLAIMVLVWLCTWVGIEIGSAR